MMILTETYDIGLFTSATQSPNNCVFSRFMLIAFNSQETPGEIVLLHFRI